jgi:hypothetical protein
VGAISSTHLHIHTKETKMTNKNAYEIRLEVLKMAKDMLDSSYHDASNAWWNMATSYAEAANKSTAEFLKQSEELMKAKPQMYTPAEIMEKAQELYGFVSKKD